jgi:hypothetical protein
MAIVPMTDATSGGIASSAEYNKLIDNIQDLDARIGAVLAANDAATRLTALEALTTNTSGAVGIGNQRLSDRLGAGITTSATADARFGSGVGIGSNVITGSASSQLTDIRSRLTAVESATGGAKPIAYLYRNTSQTVTVDTWTALSFSTARVDVGTGWASSPNPTRYKPTVAGYYRFTGMISGSAASGSAAANIYKNGAVVTGSSYSGAQGSAAINRSGQVETLAQMNGTTDYVELFGYINGAPGSFVYDAGFNVSCFLIAQWVST